MVNVSCVPDLSQQPFKCSAVELIYIKWRSEVPRSIVSQVGSEKMTEEKRMKMEWSPDNDFENEVLLPKAKQRKPKKHCQFQ